MILILFSGGIDSTAMLKKCLTETDEEIHAHHLILKYTRTLGNFSDWRWEPELSACRKVRDYLLASYREFVYTEAEFIEDPDGRNPDLTHYCQETVRLVQESPGKYTEALRGWHSEDPRAIPDMKIKFLAWHALYEADPNVKYSFPLLTWTKKEIINYLEPELLSLTLSCRFPQFVDEWLPCGDCFSCRPIKEIITNGYHSPIQWWGR